MPRVHAVRALQRAHTLPNDYMAFRRGWYYLTPSDLTFNFAPHIEHTDFNTMAALLDAALPHDHVDFRHFFSTFLRLINSYVCYAEIADFPLPADCGYAHPIYRTTHRVYYTHGFIPQTNVIAASSWIAIYVR